MLRGVRRITKWSSSGVGAWSGCPQGAESEVSRSVFVFKFPRYCQMLWMKDFENVPGSSDLSG